MGLGHYVCPCPGGGEIRGQGYGNYSTVLLSRMPSQSTATSPEVDGMTTTTSPSSSPRVVSKPGLLP